jgi:hypothetical protein
MTRLLVTLAVLAVVGIAIPVALYGQSELAETTPDKFTMVADSASGGVWRLNSNTGELWFCLASASPKCHSAENAKQ